MELTVSEALQKGVAEHNAGNLEEAEEIYRAILRVQPRHPDANHNLGVIAAAVNQTAQALPLFKLALDVNPKMEQFWVSYLDALIKENQFTTAKRAFKKVKKRGLVGERFAALQQKLMIQIKSHNRQLLPNAKHIDPPQSQLKNLLKSYSDGRYEETENLALLMTKTFPHFKDAWKVLFGTFRATGRLREALAACQKLVEIEPSDAESHYNLASLFHALGEMDEAEASYRRATVLRPNYVDAHINLGAVLADIGKLKESEKSYQSAIKGQPDSALAYSNLGVVLERLGELNEAEAAYRKAIAATPNHAEAHSNLGAMLEELGRYDEAEPCYKRAVALKPDFPEAHHNLGLLCYAGKRFSEAAQHFKLAGLENSQYELLRCLYLLGEQSQFYELLDDFISQGRVHPVVGSLACRSFIKFGVERPNLFCKDPLKFVLKTDLYKFCDFDKVFVETAEAILRDDKTPKKNQGLLTNGYQTYGNLFDLQQNEIKKIQQIIRLEVDKYRRYFKTNDEGFIGHWPSEYYLNGWLVSMNSGGALRPHMHEKGWLSGSVYINVPSQLEGDSGNLVVCIEEDLTDINQKESIDVVTGSLCLFPASLLHYTIPFESEEERIVLAFDIVPL